MSITEGSDSTAEVTTMKGKTQFVWVKDKARNEFVCPLEALKDPKKATPEELKKRN